MRKIKTNINKKGVESVKIKLPTDVRMIIDRFEKNGFSAYAVGGCVRDSLLQKEPNDWDICTDALPQDILRLFSDFHTFDTGIKHGTVSVVINSFENCYFLPKRRKRKSSEILEFQSFALICYLLSR